MSLKLNATYVVWVRCGNDWTAADFAELCRLETADDIWTLERYIVEENRDLLLSYLVIMREGILPIWEDPKNRDGGCWSIKVDLSDSLRCLFQFLILLVADEITVPKNAVNGLSFSAKNSYNTIIQIWGNSHKYNHVRHLMPIIRDDNRFEVICRLHKP
jgi:hypothetical protein